MMLTLQETLEIQDKLKLFEGEAPEFTDDQIEAAEFYHFRLNPVTYGTEVTLYNAQEEALATVSFEDADIAIAFIEDIFDVDEEDLEELDNYAWALEDDFDNVTNID